MHRPRRLVVLAVLLHAGAAAAAPRVVVWLPEGSQALAAPLARALRATDPLVLDPARLAAQFPPSPVARERAASEARAAALIGEAERAFVETRFAAAAGVLARARALLDELPPSARAHQAWVRAQLLTGRVALAQGSAADADQAFRAAAGVAPEAELDEGEYPPEVCRAYLAARAEVRRAAPRTLRVTSEPRGADIELNGRARGRTPVEKLALPPGRCRLQVTLPGFRPAHAECGAGPALAIRLAPADEATRRDVLREALLADRHWFLAPALLDALAAETGASWVLVLEPGRGDELEARLYWAYRHAVRPLVPARFSAGELGELRELGTAVRDAIAAAEGLEVRVIDPLTRAPVLEARAGDPRVITRAVAFVRPQGRGPYTRVELAAAAGRFEASMPAALLGLPGAAIDLEYYVEGFAGAETQGRVGDAERPLRFHRAALPVGGPPAPPGPPPWYGRWYFWVGVAAVLVGATVGTIYAVRPTDVSIVLGGK